MEAVIRLIHALWTVFTEGLRVSVGVVVIR